MSVADCMTACVTAVTACYKMSDRHPLRPSLFPGVAPYLRFLPVVISGHDHVTCHDKRDSGHEPPLPPEMRQIAISAPNGISPIVEVRAH